MSQQQTNTKGQIGPHEGLEFALLEAGQKHVAYWCDWIPDEYEEYKSRPDYDAIEWEIPVKLSEEQISALRKRGADYKGLHDDDGVIQIPYRILYRKTHEADAKRLEHIIRNYGTTWKPELEREIGAILGYSQDDIEAFIERLPKAKSASP